MKRSKKLSLTLIGLILAFALMGCNADNETDLDEDQVAIDDVQDDEQEVVDTDELEVEDEEDENLLEEKKPEETADEDTAADSDIVMIRESDYIAKIKLIKKGSDTSEIKVLENIKGNLTHDNLPAMESLELNRAYLVFLKDADGSAVLTDTDNSLILLENDNHEIFEKINKEIHNN